jgi:hypothetical protein
MPATQALNRLFIDDCGMQRAACFQFLLDPLPLPSLFCLFSISIAPRVNEHTAPYAVTFSVRLFSAFF